MRTPPGRARPLLAAWIAVALAAGLLAAAGLDGPPTESVAVGAAPEADAPRPSTTARPTTTAAPTTTSTLPPTTTTSAPVAATTIPPTTGPPPTEAPTTAPPTTAPPTTVPPRPPLEIWFGPEVYADTGQPFIHVRGTGCTGPDHTEGGPEFIWNYPLQPGQYGVSYVYTTLEGEWLIRMDPMHAQPGSGDWELTIPPTGGAGEFLVTAVCVNPASVIQPWGSAPSWTGIVLEYPPQRFAMPG